MSEYQYYEFKAIDRPLTVQEQATLRKYSSRATITSSRFAVDYSWGDFKGNAAEWMEKYFDAFAYLANWGTHEVMLRLPRSVLPLETAKRYCAGNFASVRARGDHVVLRFWSDDEEGGEWIAEDNDTLASLLPMRAELAGGDLRAKTAHAGPKSLIGEERELGGALTVKDRAREHLLSDVGPMQPLGTRRLDVFEAGALEPCP